MKKTHRLIIGLFWIPLHINSGLYAQEQNKKTYSFDVQMITGEPRKGILKSIDGTNLIIREKGSDSLLSIPASDIRVVKIRKVNVGGHIIKGAGIIIGAATGFALGYLIGSSSDPQCDDGSCIDWGPELRGIGQGLIGGTLGGVAGSLLGNHAKKYVIDGLPENFETMKMTLSK